MSKEHYETWAGRKGRRRGAAYAERRPLNVPWDLAVGNYEGLSDLQLREALNDLTAEHDRRNGRPAAAPKFNPLASQIRRPHAN